MFNIGVRAGYGTIIDRAPGQRIFMHDTHTPTESCVLTQEEWTGLRIKTLSASMWWLCRCVCIYVDV